MAKPDPALLDPTRYPHSVEIPTRYADCDPNNHINNVALAAIIVPIYSNRRSAHNRAAHGSCGRQLHTGVADALLHRKAAMFRLYKSY